MHGACLKNLPTSCVEIVSSMFENRLTFMHGSGACLKNLSPPHALLCHLQPQARHLHQVALALLARNVPGHMLEHADPVLLREARPMPRVVPLAAQLPSDLKSKDL